MELTINTSLSASTTRQTLYILVDSENLQHVQDTYKISDLNALIEATQFKASFNETLPLIGKLPEVVQCTLLGLDKASEIQASKLAKIAQTIIKASQKKHASISIDISALPSELHYLFALSLTQAAYSYDEYKSKKNGFSLENIEFIASTTTLSNEQLGLVKAVQSGQNYSRDLVNCQPNICYS